MPYKYNDRVIPSGRAWTDSKGITHPGTWNTAWSEEEKVAKGLVWHADPKPHDNRFYWGWNAEQTELIPRKLEDEPQVDEAGDPILDEFGNQVVTKGLKSNAIDRVKTQAAGLLSPTDWYFTRANETSVDVPVSVLGYRDSIRKASQDIEAAITACSTLDEFIALHDSVEGAGAPINAWPVDDGSHAPTITHVSMRQARLALLAAGLLDQVDAAITDPAARIEWEYASIVRKESVLITDLAAGLGLTDAEVDSLFETAFTL